MKSTLDKNFELDLTFQRILVKRTVSKCLEVNAHDHPQARPPRASEARQAGQCRVQLTEEQLTPEDTSKAKPTICENLVSENGTLETQSKL